MFLIFFMSFSLSQFFYFFSTKGKTVRLFSFPLLLSLWCVGLSRVEDNTIFSFISIFSFLFCFFSIKRKSSTFFFHSLKPLPFILCLLSFLFFSFFSLQVLCSRLRHIQGNIDGKNIQRVSCHLSSLGKKEERTITICFVSLIFVCPTINFKEEHKKKGIDLSFLAKKQRGNKGENNDEQICFASFPLFSSVPP